MDRRTIPDSATEGFWTADDGHRIRRIDWPRASESARGSLLFMPGRGDFYEKYLETLEHWHADGWQVTSSDWRGQGISGRLGADGVTGHIDDFSDWVDDLATLFSQWQQETPGPHVIVGHSMGGHIVLRALAERRIAPVSAVLVAPMLGLVPAFVPLAFLHPLARVLARLTAPYRSAWKGNERPAMLLDDRGKLLTHDEDRYDDETWWREHRPGLAMAAPSWGWIERAIASMRHLRKPGLLEAISCPVLFLAARKDKLVDYKAITKAASRVPQAQLVTFGGGARHELLREADDVRDKVLDTIADFLDRTVPGETRSQ